MTYIYPPSKYKETVYLRAQKARPRQQGEVIYVFRTVDGESYGFTKRQLELVVKLIDADSKVGGRGVRTPFSVYFAETVSRLDGA